MFSYDHQFCVQHLDTCQTTQIATLEEVTVGAGINSLVKVFSFIHVDICYELYNSDHDILGQKVNRKYPDLENIFLNR